LWNCEGVRHTDIIFLVINITRNMLSVYAFLESTTTDSLLMSSRDWSKSEKRTQ
jgi:hypothetical protein